jgi:hypothetical protein
MTPTDQHGTDQLGTDQGSPDQEREFAELTSFLDVWATQVLGIDPKAPWHPANVAPRIRESEGLPRALEGARQAIRDTLEGLREASPASIQEFDAALREGGFVTITALRERYAQ